MRYIKIEKNKNKNNKIKNNNQNMDNDIKFNAQMEFVRERNRIKYENKLMHDEDILSQNVRPIFEREREDAQTKKELERISKQHVNLQEQLEMEQTELSLFVEEYLMNKIQREARGGYCDLDFDDVMIEAENIFYDRLLKKKQDEEYNQTIIHDMRNRLRHEKTYEPSHLL